jgi:hypothetical protein
MASQDVTHVPRRDATDDAARRVDELVLSVLVLRDSLGLEVPNLGHLSTLVGDAHHLAHGHAERLALLHGESLRELFALGRDELTELEDARCALLERRGGPGLERLGGGINRAVEVLPGAVRDVVCSHQEAGGERGQPCN